MTTTLFLKVIKFTDVNVDLKSLLKEVGYINWSEDLNDFPLIACDKFVPIIKLIGLEILIDD